MHNQHRSPDPTKIERATATSTVALFFYFLSSIWLYLFIFFLSVKSSLVPYIVSMDISSNERMTMQNLQISETAESRIVPKRLFPPRFPDKDRFTSSRPDFVLVTPIAAKTQKQQETNVGGWVLRSGRGQLRETGSTSAAAPATNSTATNPRQHRPEDLNKTRRDIHLVEIKYCDDTRPQNQLNAAKVRHKDLCSISEEPPLLSTSSFWVWAAPSTTPTL